MKDFGPGETGRIERIREAFVRTAGLFAFEMIEPSPIESLKTIEAKSGPAIRDEVYHFQDKGGREVALRFDFTVGLARYVASDRSMALPARLGSFGGVFRYDEPQKGRYRFFHQWNAEIFGASGIEAEAEIIELASALFCDLGMDVQMRIGHRGLAEALIRDTYPGDVSEKAIADAFRMLDKAAKKPREKLLAEYAHLPDIFASKLLDFAAIRGTPDEIEEKADVKNLAHWDHLRELWAMLGERGIRDSVLDLGIVRGLDYYSGMVFEVYAKNSDLGALAGGGRYDALMGAFGRGELGAVGVAGGVERMNLIMDEQGAPAVTAPQRTAVLYTNKDSMRYASKIASQIRAKGIRVYIDLAGRNLKKQMELARSCRRALIIGPKEIKDKTITLRDMKTRTEETVDAKAFLADAKGRLS